VEGKHDAGEADPATGQAAQVDTGTLVNLYRRLTGKEPTEEEVAAEWVCWARIEKKLIEMGAKRCQRAGVGAPAPGNDLGNLLCALQLRAGSLQSSPIHPAQAAYDLQGPGPRHAAMSDALPSELETLPPLPGLVLVLSAVWWSITLAWRWDGGRPRSAELIPASPPRYNLLHRRSEGSAVQGLAMPTGRRLNRRPPNVFRPLMQFVG
jgi:hypothetical protein